MHTCENIFSQWLWTSIFVSCEFTSDVSWPYLAPPNYDVKIRKILAGINFFQFRENSRKSVTWSAVPNAPILVYVGMWWWEGQRPQRGQWPMIPHRAIFSSFNFPSVWRPDLLTNGPDLRSEITRFGSNEVPEAWAEKSNLDLGRGNWEKWSFEMLSLVLGGLI